MKTLLLSAMFIFLFFTNPNQTAMAQNPNTLTLDFDSGTAISITERNCPVKARVAYVATGVNQPKSGWTVTFTLWSGPGPVPLSGNSDAKGLVKRKITWNTEIQAFVSVSQNVLLKSDRIKCHDNSKTQ